MNLTSSILLASVIMASLSWAGKQKIIVVLREPLRAETIKISVPELTNGRGETRDLEAKVELGQSEKIEVVKTQDPGLKLNMQVSNVGKNGVQVNLSLPTAGFVEVGVMDFYGKSLALLFSGNLPPGVHPLGTHTLKEGDNNGIKFMTLRVNGKVVLKKVITKVR